MNINLPLELATRKLQVKNLLEDLEIDRKTYQNWVNGAVPLRKIHVLAIRQ